MRLGVRRKKRHRDGLNPERSKRYAGRPESVEGI